MKTYECIYVARAINLVQATNKKEAWEKFCSGEGINWGGLGDENMAHLKSTLRQSKREWKDEE
jgi:hypothetical protein